MTNRTTGFKELSAQLKEMGRAAGGSALRSAAMASMKVAQQAASFAAPSGVPPYGPYKGRTKPQDPYPKKTYKGRLVAPGFTSRSIVRSSRLSRDKTFVKVSLGVRKEAFYALQFIELGTSKIPKRPWLEPSFRSSIGQVDVDFQQRLRKLIDRAARK